MSSQITADAVDYSRRLLELVINWYKNADSKAQVILIQVYAEQLRERERITKEAIDRFRKGFS